jgi:glycosyltransferase involved in cell wall biosynthesis
VSEAERQLVSTVAPNAPDPYVVPNAVETGAYADDYGQPEADTIVFSGALSYAPNYQGAQWFLRSVYPLVRQQLPQAKLRITGGLQGVEVDGLRGHPGCELTGYVPDIRPVVARSAVAVVPLWTGGGTRLKILEAMALGTPVVSTTKGAEGLEVSHGENILLADDPAEFAEYVAAVTRSPPLRAHLAAGGRALVRSRYDWDVVGPLLCEIAERAAAGSTAMPTGSHA